MSTPDRPGPGGPGLPEHEQQVWDAIVADLRDQLDLGPAWTPAAPEVDDRGDDGPTGLDDEADDEADDDTPSGFVPPDPPPVPLPTEPAARLGWAALAGGPVLAVAANMLHWGDWLVGAGIVMTISGFAALMAQRADHRDDDGDGAVV